MRTQFNVRIQKRVAQRVKVERKTAPMTRDIIVEVALEHWFSKFTPEQRAAFYKAHDRKPYFAI